MNLVHRVATLFLGVSGAMVSADGWAARYTMAMEPAYPQAQTMATYTPLARYLSQTTKDTFILEAAKNYHAFWADVRKGNAPDFYFTEAHFADYIMRRWDYVPLVKTEENTQFLVLADYSQAEKGIPGLVGQRIISMPSPSLGMATLAEIFDNPVGQPDISSAATTWRDGVEMIFAGEAAATVVPSYIANLYPNLATVAEGRQLPGRVLLASGKVPEEARAKVITAMMGLRNSDVSEVREVLAELGTEGFVKAEKSEYLGQEYLLRHFFGYKALNGIPVLPPAKNPESLDEAEGASEGEADAPSNQP